MKHFILATILLTTSSFANSLDDLHFPINRHVTEEVSVEIVSLNEIKDDMVVRIICANNPKLNCYNLEK